MSTGPSTSGLHSHLVQDNESQFPHYAICQFGLLLAFPVDVTVELSLDLGHLTRLALHRVSIDVSVIQAFDTSAQYRPWLLHSGVKAQRFEYELLCS